MVLLDMLILILLFDDNQLCVCFWTCGSGYEEGDSCTPVPSASNHTALLAAVDLLQLPHQEEAGQYWGSVTAGETD